MKKVLLKAPACIQINCDVAGLPLSSVSIITRKPHGLDQLFFCENFDKMQLFLSQLSKLESEAVGKAQIPGKDNDVRNKLYATNPAKFLADKITKLETMNYLRQSQILNETTEKPNGFAREKVE